RGARRATGSIERARQRQPLRRALAGGGVTLRRELRVVDDDQATCNLLERELLEEGYAVTSVTRAGDALERLAERDFEVVLTDLNMPGMSGIELCARIVERR